MPIINADSARWSNANMTAAQNFESRISQGSKEHTGMEGQNASSPARTFEGRIIQETGTH